MKLPLYPEPPASPIDSADRQNIDHSCRLCSRAGRGTSTCIAPDGTPGGILVVMEYPTQAEDEMGRPLVSAAGRYVRAMVQNHYSGPVVYDMALKCRGVKDEVLEDVQVNACRGYLAATMDEALPDRILAFGAVAHQSLLGRQPMASSVAGGYGWVTSGGRQIPVFIFPNAMGAYRNKFQRAELEKHVARVLTEPLPTPKHGGTYTSVEHANLLQVEEELRAGYQYALDIETAGQMHNRDFTVLFAALGDAKRNHAWVWTTKSLEAPTWRAVFQRVLDRAIISGANIKFDLRGLSQLGFRLPKAIEDIQTWRRIMEPEARVGLEIMADLTGLGGHKDEMEAELERAKKAAMKTVAAEAKAENQGMLFPEFGPPPMLPAVKRGVAEGADWRSWAYGAANPTITRRYNCRDAVTTAHLRDLVRRQLDGDPEATLVWEEIMRPAIRTAIAIENNGIACSKSAIQVWAAQLGQEQIRLAEAFSLWGVNPSSNPQVAKFLFEDNGLPVVKQTDGGAPSVDDEVLQILQNRHPAVKYLIEWRKVSKNRSTYADGGGVILGPNGYEDAVGSGGMGQWIRDDGRIHGSLKLTGTRTGRLSMEDPSLQNLPIIARTIMVAGPGNVLVQVDFKANEFRVAAMLSGDQAMMDVINSGDDIHMSAARILAKDAWGILPSEVTDFHRKQAKTVVFGLLYGKGDEGLAQDLGISVADAARIRKAVFGNFKALGRWLQEQVAEVVRTGMSWSTWGGKRARRRPLFDVASDDTYKVGNAKRAAMNGPIQGLASDFCLVALCRVQEFLERQHHPAKLVGTVHDSILLECPEPLALALAHDVMAICVDFDTPVPLAVDVEFGQTWGTMKKLVAPA